MVPKQRDSKLLIIFFLALAKSDSIYVLMLIIDKALKALFNLDGKKFYVKLIASPVSNVAYNTSIYFTVLLAFERYVSICLPKKAKKWCTLSKTKMYIIAIPLLTLIYTIPRFFQRKLVFNMTRYEITGYF